MRNPLSRAFRALENFNFRLWTAGGLVSNIGTWMQRVAQDWIVLTQLTHHDATAVGIVTGLQFAPQLLLLPWSGLAADRLNQRKLLMLTQASMGVLATALGVLTVTSGFGMCMCLPLSLAPLRHWMRQCGKPLLGSWWVTNTCLMQSHSTQPRSSSAR